MRINFFEECLGTPETDLESARLITWPSTIYIAANSMTEFERRRNILFLINPSVEAAYWPVLPKSYWISPFSDPKELDALRIELLAYEGPPIVVLLDLELPTLKPDQFFRNAFSFFSNRKRIHSLLALRKDTIRFATAEYWYAIGWASFLARIFGTSYLNHETNHLRLIMYYSSLLHKNGLVSYAQAMNYMKVALSKERASEKGVQAAIGTTNVGIYGNETNITTEQLDYDLDLLKSAGYKETTIFRLAGIEPYLETIKKYLN